MTAKFPIGSRLADMVDAVVTADRTVAGLKYPAGNSGDTQESKGIDNDLSFTPKADRGLDIERMPISSLSTSDRWCVRVEPTSVHLGTSSVY